MCAVASSSASDDDEDDDESRHSTESENVSSTSEEDEDDEGEDEDENDDLSGSSEAGSSSASVAEVEQLPRRRKKTNNRVLVKYVQCKQDAVREVIRTAGWKKARKDYEDWDMAWGDTSAALFQAVTLLKPFQCVNHFPFMQLICRKDMLAQHLSAIKHACQVHGAEECSFFPETWVFPMDVLRFWADVPKLKERKRRRSKNAVLSEDNDELLTFIAKPRSLSKGQGIVLFQLRRDLRKTPETLKKMIDEREKVVVQRFLSRPHLIDGYKWDMRVYVLVTNVEPLTAYLYTDGLARFCTEHYEAPNASNLDNMEMHLTNFAINCESANFVDTEDDETGSKRSLRVVLDQIESNPEYSGDSIWGQISIGVRKTLMAIAPKLQEHYGRYYGQDPARKRCACFEILGFDFILTDCCELMLLEVNSAPSFATPSTLDAQVKEGVLGEALELLGLDAGAKREHQRMRAQQLEARRSEHVQRRKELLKAKDENLRNSVGFGRRFDVKCAAAQGDSGSKSNPGQQEHSLKEEQHVDQKELGKEPPPYHTEGGLRKGRSREEEDDEEFIEIGPRATEHYVRIMPCRSTGPWEEEFVAAAAVLAKSWRIGSAGASGEQRCQKAGPSTKIKRRGTK